MQLKLSEIVRKYRAEKDISQREFAKRCDLSNSYISFIENECNPKTGRPMTPTIEQYKKLANGMSMTVQNLFELLDQDSPVVLNDHKSYTMNLQLFGDTGTPPDEPANDDVRLLIRGLNKLSPEQLEQATNMMKIMFTKYADYFDKEKTDNDA